MPKKTKIPVYRETSFKKNDKPQTRLRNLNNGRFVSIGGKKRNVKGYWKLVNEIKSKPMGDKTKQQKLDYSRRYIKLYVKGQNKINRMYGEKRINWRALDSKIKSNRRKGVFKLPEVESP